MPTIKVEDLTEQQIKAFRIADNKTSEFAEWDMELLEIELEGLDNEFTGFDIDELGELFNDDTEVTEDDFDEEPPEEPISKRGDIWLLGRHRLMCGDSTSEEDVDTLMDGNKADMIFTDPPYNIAYEGGSKKRERIKNDKMNDFYPFLLNVYTNLMEYSKAGSSIYVTHADSERINFTKAFIDAGFYLSSVIIWVKNNATFGRQDYKWRHEPILYGWNSKGSHRYYGEMTEDTVWEIKRPSVSIEHPTMKPIELIVRALKNSSVKDNIVLDVFGGSGSTLIACEQLNRICYMMELDEKYVDVIVNRYIKFKESDEDVFLIRDGVQIPYKEVEKTGLN